VRIRTRDHQRFSQSQLSVASGPYLWALRIIVQVTMESKSAKAIKACTLLETPFPGRAAITSRWRLAARAAGRRRGAASGFAIA
jgi:hypothetical protein